MVCRCALTASLRATRGQPRKNQTDDIRMSNNARRYPPSVYPNRYTVGRYQAGTADSWSYPPVVRRSGCMAGRYVCGIVNRRRYLPAVRWSGCMAGRWVAGVMRVPLLSACGATVRSHDKPIPRVLGRQIPVTCRRPLAVTHRPPAAHRVSNCSISVAIRSLVSELDSETPPAAPSGASLPSASNTTRK